MYQTAFDISPGDDKDIGIAEYATLLLSSKMYIGTGVEMAHTTQVVSEVHCSAPGLTLTLILTLPGTSKFSF